MLQKLRTPHKSGVDVSSEQLSVALAHMAPVMLQKWEQRFNEVEFPCLIMLNWMHSWGLHLGFKSEDLWPKQLPRARSLLLPGDTQLKLVVWLV